MDRMKLQLVVALTVLAGACGSVTTAATDARNDAAGGAGAAGGEAAAGTSGLGGRGGAGGELGGRGGATAGTLGTAGAGGTAPAVRPWNAPICAVGTGTRCPGSFDGGVVEITVDGGVPGSGVNSWLCEYNCTAEPVLPCTRPGHVYCVADCSQCAPFSN